MCFIQAVPRLIRLLCYEQLRTVLGAFLVLQDNQWSHAVEQHTPRPYTQAYALMHYLGVVLVGRGADPANHPTRLHSQLQNARAATSMWVYSTQI